MPKFVETAVKAKPNDRKCSEIISDIERGLIKIPVFQRDYVWSLNQTASLLDSILKGYPIGTLILWQTNYKLNEIRNIGNYELPDSQHGIYEYVLDGQQRLTSIFAAFKAVEVSENGKVESDFGKIYLNFGDDIDPIEDALITLEPTGDNYISILELLQCGSNQFRKELQTRLGPELTFKICDAYSDLMDYEFSVVELRDCDIETAIEVFTRINTSGKSLTLFEIMSAKTYDQESGFDLSVKWESFCEQLANKGYENLNNSIILMLIALLVSEPKECKRKIILHIDKESFIEQWDNAISYLERAVDFLKGDLGIAVSQLLPYDAILVPLSYFFALSKKKPMQEKSSQLLQEFFWMVSLSQRYSNAQDTKIARDIKRIEQIISNEQPSYSDYNINLGKAQDLIETKFSTGSSFCKAILCLYAQQIPKNFNNNTRVKMDNSFMSKSNSKNFHHFFPRAYLRRKGLRNENSIVNITLISKDLNHKIKDQEPSAYMAAFAEEIDVEPALKTHLISYEGFGIKENDYQQFLASRSQLIFKELEKKVSGKNLVTKSSEDNEPLRLILLGEGPQTEFKSTMQYSMHNHEVDTKLRLQVAKTVVAFMNSNGGNLFIGVADDGTVLGLDNDLSTLNKQKRNIDGFSLKLNELIKNHVGISQAGLITANFPTIENKAVCWLSVSSSKEPVFLKDKEIRKFYIRNLSSTELLNAEQQSKYITSHFRN